MDSIAVSYADELARWDIEASIIAPDAFTKDIHHVGRARAPADAARAVEYAGGPIADIPDMAMKRG